MDFVVNNARKQEGVPVDVEMVATEIHVLFVFGDGTECEEAFVLPERTSKEYVWKPRLFNNSSKHTSKYLRLMAHVADDFTKKYAELRKRGPAYGK